MNEGRNYKTKKNLIDPCGERARETTYIFPQREKCTDSNYNVIIQKLSHHIIIYQLLS